MSKSNPVASESVTTPLRGAERESRASTRAILDAAMSERAFQESVIGLAKTCGWLVHHQTVPFRVDDRGRHRAIAEPNTDRGFPDLVLVDQVRGIVLFCELKREGGRLSYAQMQWREAIVRAGGRYYLFRPSDWDEVCRVLS